MTLTRQSPDYYKNLSEEKREKKKREYKRNRYKNMSDKKKPKRKKYLKSYIRARKNNMLSDLLPNLNRP